MDVMNARQQRFVTEYLIDLNATQAAIRAGYSRKTAQQQGSRLLTNVVVKRAIAAQQDRQLKSVEVRIEDVLHDLRKLRRALDRSMRQMGCAHHPVYLNGDPIACDHFRALGPRQ